MTYATAVCAHCGKEIRAKDAHNLGSAIDKHAQSCKTAKGKQHAMFRLYVWRVENL